MPEVEVVGAVGPDQCARGPERQPRLAEQHEAPVLALDPLGFEVPAHAGMIAPTGRGHKRRPFDVGRGPRIIARMRGLPWTYLTRFSKNWTMKFSSIGVHYLGLEDLRQGNKDAGLDRLQRAFAYNPLESTADVIAEITGVRPPMRTPLVDQRGTIRYEGGLESVEWWDTLSAVAG